MELFKTLIEVVGVAKVLGTLLALMVFVVSVIAFCILLVIFIKKELLNK